MRLLLLLPALASAFQLPLQSPLLEDDDDAAAAAALATLPLPSSQLPWSDLNILSTTDTHGWVRGHHASRSPPESLYSADLGDLISFKAHLERIADERGVDILTVDSGDTLDGNGFVDADTSGVKGRAARELLADVHYDVATTGNHELYNRTVALDVYRNFIPRFKGRYLSSNVFFDDGAGERPFGDLYATFVTKNRGYRITSFGVLFNFNRADEGFRVQAPSELVKQSWWQKVLRDEMGRTDVFLIVGHMATRDQDWKIVFNSIRELHPTTPILIFSGHAHVRDCVRPDAHSQILASGRYMETLGFTSLSLSATASPRSSNSISRRYLDTNLATYHFHSRTTQTNFSTLAGRRTKRALSAYAAQFNLSHSFGVAPQSYYLNRYPPTHPKSLLRLYTHDVFPALLSATEERHAPARVLFNTGAARFDIFKGNFTRDAQFAVIPFENGLWYIPSVPIADAQAVVDWLNNLPGEPELTSLAVDAAHHRVLVDSLEVSRRRRAEAVQFVTSGTTDSKLSYGYVTQDACFPDAGGDDTPHRPLPAYDIPDFILSQPSAASGDSAGDEIDLVFYEFIAGLVVHALNAVQTDRTYARADVAVYSELKASELLGEYARMAWNN